MFENKPKLSLISFNNKIVNLSEVSHNLWAKSCSQSKVVPKSIAHHNLTINYVAPYPRPHPRLPARAPRRGSGSVAPPARSHSMRMCGTEAERRAKPQHRSRISPTQECGSSELKLREQHFLTEKITQKKSFKI